MCGVGYCFCVDIVWKDIDEVIPYVNNPRVNAGAVDGVAASLQEFGWQQPIVVDCNNVIVAGHTRFLAARRLGFEKIPVTVADNLSEQQVKAYRLADNRVGELAAWDLPKLQIELESLDDFAMTGFGFEPIEGDWFESGDAGLPTDEDDDEYREFVEKFEPKRTTDDCYTPKDVYEAVAGWVALKYGVDRGRFVRPFYPGGDYERHDYPPGCVVVDNPPFSILAQIRRFYLERGIPYFLFAPQLTLFSAKIEGDCLMPVGCDIRFENGAHVACGFATNMDDARVAVYPDLYDQVMERVRAIAPGEPERYRYPPELFTASMGGQLAKGGQEFRLVKVAHVAALDAQKAKGKGIYGSAFLMGKEKTQEAADKMVKAVEVRAAEEARLGMLDEAGKTVWELSDREKEIVEGLSND